MIFASLMMSRPLAAARARISQSIKPVVTAAKLAVFRKVLRVFMW
jgi:hypothetical protein